MILIMQIMKHNFLQEKYCGADVRFRLVRQVVPSTRHRRKCSLSPTGTSLASTHTALLYRRLIPARNIRDTAASSPMKNRHSLPYKHVRLLL